jgi:prevent-host-death family protein
MREAQANLTKLCRSGRRFVISNRNRPVVVGLPIEDFEALMETLDVLADPAAVKAVQENLKKGVAGTSKVYELIVPEKKIAVFGVAMNNEDKGDAAIINKIGIKDRVAGFPYEVFVVNNEVHAFYGRYRLALAFPDLSMGHFMRIVYAPEEIQGTLTKVAGGKPR